MLKFRRYILRFLQPCEANFNNALSIPAEGHSLIPRHVFRCGRVSGLAMRETQLQLAPLQLVSRRAIIRLRDDRRSACCCRNDQAAYFEPFRTHQPTNRRDGT